MPGLVAAVTLGARRWGPRVGGWLTALPLVAGPALFFLAMEQGHAFAARAAVSTLVGLIAVSAFGVVYAWVALRAAWPVSLLAGWLAFVLVTVLLQSVRWTLGPGLAATLGAFAVAGRVLPAEHVGMPTAPPPAWDLPLRMLGTLGVVLGVTHAAERLGPDWSGALTPFPVALAVLLVFSHAQQGGPLAVRLLHGFFPAMWGFGLFCAVLAVAMVPLGPWRAFALALLAQLAVHALVLWRMLARPAS